MDHVDLLKECVQELIILVLLKDHLDVKLEHVLLILTVVQLQMDVIINIHKDVLKLDYVLKI